MPSQSKFLRPVLVLLILLAGCGGSQPTVTTTTTGTTADDEPSAAAIRDILAESDAVAAVLVNGTYVMETGCVNRSRAAVFIRTGHHYEQHGNVREAAGGSLYYVRMNLTNSTVTEIDARDSAHKITNC